MVKAQLDTIHEQPSQYVGHGGCMDIMFSAEWNESDVVCQRHGSEWEPHCRHCANHQFMVHKHRHEVNEAIAIQRSMHNTSVIWVERGGQLWATCSNHPNNNKQEYCSACTMVVQLLATGHGVKAMWWGNWMSLLFVGWAMGRQWDEAIWWACCFLDLTLLCQYCCWCSCQHFCCVDWV